jgi:hypothetical protein
MSNLNHEEKIKQIEAETAEIKRQMMKLEFQHKKDIVEAQKRFDEAEKRFDERSDKIQRQLDYITKLVGISFEELDQMDERLFSASIPLGQRLSRNKSS